MKVQELLEAISLSTERDRTTNVILGTIDDVMMDIYKNMINHYIPLEQVTTQEQLVQKTRSLLERDFKRRLQLSLTNAFNREPYNVFRITFEPLPKGIDGQARVESVELNEKFLTYLIKMLADSVADTYGDPVFYEDGTIDTSTLHQIFDNYKHTSNSYMKVIEQLVGVIIHEVVHIKQHKGQMARYVDTGQLEYRSYITNKKRFYQAMENIYKDKASQEDMDAYLASPQEIPAHAHNLALELINAAMAGYTSHNMDLHDISYLLYNLDEVLKYNVNYMYNPKFAEYNKFNTPENRKHYQIFKRFMKLVYREIVAYIDHIKTLKKELEDKKHEQDEREAQNKYWN